MTACAERQLVYTALLIACAVIALAAGPLAGAFSFGQVAVIIELAYWLGRHRGYTRRRW